MRRPGLLRQPLARSLGGIAALLALCALPARGQSVALEPQILYALTSSDEPLSKADLEAVLANPPNELAMLQGYATGSGYDFGVRLRAIRAIPHFCDDPPTACHAAIRAVLDGIDAAGGSDGQKLLRRRAAIEALAAARAHAPEDLARLFGFLGDGSRDLRVAAARALRDLCDPAAKPALLARKAAEQVAQVKVALDEALAAVARCGP